MLKPNAIREILTRANPHLLRDPDKLHVFLDSGSVVAYGARSLSWEYRYTLHVIVQDYPDHADRIILPLLAYLRTNQPELFENREKAQNLIRFEAEMLNEQAMDLAIQIDLTERVIVSKENNKLTAAHVGEPDHPEFPKEEILVDIYDRSNDALLGSFSMDAWDPEL